MCQLLYCNWARLYATQIKEQTRMFVVCSTATHSHHGVPKHRKSGLNGGLAIGLG